MKNLKDILLNEYRIATKEFEADENLSIVKKNADTFTVRGKKYSGKFILLCGDKYTYHMKGDTNYYDEDDNIHLLNFYNGTIGKYGTDEDWDLPEIYYSDSKQALLKRIDAINDDNYFRDHSERFSFSEDDIIEVSKITKPIKVYGY